MTTTNTFTRLPRGNWGAKIFDKRPSAGDEVTVATKDGGTRTIRVKAVAGQGTLGGREFWLVAIEPSRFVTLSA